jgi:hypothetical protein
MLFNLSCALFILVLGYLCMKIFKMFLEYFWNMFFDIKKTHPLLIKQDIWYWSGNKRWFSPGTPASSTTKTGRHDIDEILLKVALKHQKSNPPLKDQMVPESDSGISFSKFSVSRLLFYDELHSFSTFFAVNIDKKLAVD